MIISHQKKFIFVKNHKVAGTSMELFLSMFCGAGDVVTPVGDEPEFIPKHLADKFQRKQRFQNCAGFVNHMPGPRIREKIGRDLWDQYFTFCFDRNPISKIKSLYHFRAASLVECADAAKFIVDGAYPYFRSDAGNYMADGELITRKVGNFDTLLDDFGQISEHLELPFGGDFGFRAKAQHRNIDKSELVIDGALTQAIADAYALEAKHLEWMGVKGFKPSSPAVLHWCEARVSRANGQLNKASKHIKRALDADRHHAPSWMESAKLNWRRDRSDKAFSNIARAIEIEPSRIVFYQTLASWQSATNQFEAAERTLRNALERSPDYPKLYSDLAMVFFKNGDLNAASKFMENSLSRYEENSNTWVRNRLLLLCWQDRSDDAVTLLQQRLPGKKEVSSDLELPFGVLSFEHGRRCKRIIAKTEVDKKRYRSAAGLLLDRSAIQIDGGLDLVDLVNSLGKIDDAALLHEVVGTALTYQPTHSKFFLAAFRALRRHPDADLIRRATEQAQKTNPDSKAIKKKSRLLYNH